MALLEVMSMGLVLRRGDSRLALEDLIVKTSNADFTGMAMRHH